LAVMMYVRFPLSLRQVEDLLHERGIDISYETVRAWWNRFGPMFASEIKKTRSASMHCLTQWRWHLVLYQHDNYGCSWLVSVSGKARLAGNGRSPCQGGQRSPETLS
jgi:hypothetical protein